MLSTSTSSDLVSHSIHRSEPIDNRIDPRIDSQIDSRIRNLHSRSLLQSSAVSDIYTVDVNTTGDEWIES